jgi:hypothetical protein
MIKTTFIFFLLITSLFSNEYINFGKFNNDDSLFVQKDISLLSEKFLNISYVSNTLSNNDINTSKENLIINFDALDCFTFIDTIEALKGSTTKDQFKNNLVEIRYKNGNISYQMRNHFFSDWIVSNSMSDITCTLGPCKKVTKYLNQNEKYLKEIATVKRQISYIKTTKIDLSLLKNGDYIGIYTDKKALDVTHTGLIIKKFDKVFIRHASSLEKKIIDSELLEYTKNKSGIIVYRATN